MAIEPDILAFPGALRRSRVLTLRQGRRIGAAQFRSAARDNLMSDREISGARARDIESIPKRTSDGAGWRGALNIGDAAAAYLIVEPKGPME